MKFIMLILISNQFAKINMIPASLGYFLRILYEYHIGSYIMFKSVNS
jgi:hypothetical protein